jgi:hypothetical protein
MGNFLSQVFFRIGTFQWVTGDSNKEIQTFFLGLYFKRFRDPVSGTIWRS